MSYKTATGRFSLQSVTMDTTLEEFKENKQLNAAIVEHCHYLGIVTLRDLIDYYFKYFRFYDAISQLKVEEKIHELCARYLHLYDGHLKNEKKAPDLDEVQFENYLRFYQQKISFFPRRIIATLCPSNPLKFYQEYIQGDKSFHFLDKFSKYAIQDLDEIRLGLRQYALELTNKPKSFGFDELADTCVKHYGCTQKQMEAFRKQAEAGRFPLFGFITYLIDAIGILSDEEVEVMKYLLRWDNNFKINSSIGITSGRTSIIDRFLHSFVEKLNPLIAHRKFMAQVSSYEFDDKLPYITMTTETAEHINNEENTYFSPYMYSFLVKCFFLPQHEQFVQPKISSNAYLIKKEVMEGVKINAFFLEHEFHLNYLANKVNSEEFTDLISPFVRYNTVQLKPIAEELIRHLFSNYESLNGILTTDNQDNTDEKSEFSFGNIIVEKAKQEKITSLPKKDKKDTELYGYYAYVAELEKSKAS